MQYEVTKKFRWEAAHRLVGHPGLCKHIHGHSFHLEVTLGSDRLDEVGMAIEFSGIKDMLHQLIAEKLDHALILWEEDPLIPFLLSQRESGNHQGQAAEEVSQRIFKLPANPTSENLAEYFYTLVLLKLPLELCIVRIKLSETETVSATVRP